VLYELLKEPLLRLLSAPLEPPQPPAGSQQSVRVFKASPRYLSLELFVHFASMASALGVEGLLWAFSPGRTASMALGLVSGIVVVGTLGITVLRYFLIRLDYDMRFYVVTDRSLRIRRGALSIEESTYTFANVQNLSLREGPLERVFGLMHLHIDTAGGGSMPRRADSSDVMDHRGRLEGMERASAQELRDQILSRVTRHTDSGLGDERLSRVPLARPSGDDARRTRLPRAILSELRQLNDEAAARGRETGPV
jgi:membrane protein YdbS with pleckstrin-like domain